MAMDRPICRFVHGFALFFLATAPVSALALPIPANSLHDLDWMKFSRVRVRIAPSLSEVRLSGFDLDFYSGATALSSARLAHRAAGKSKWELRCGAGHVRMTSLGADETIQELTPPVRVSSRAGFVTMDSKSIRDTAVIYAQGSRCEVINELEVETYLIGLVNSEFSSQWNPQAIGAQVIAARTYAVHQIRQARMDFDRHADLDATTADQVYLGTEKEDHKAARGVVQTRGQILTTQEKGRWVPLKAYYHSTCGGVTELPENVWGKKASGFRHRAQCPYCRVSPRFQWALDVSEAELKKAVLSLRPNWKAFLANARLGYAHEGQKNLSGRVGEVLTVWHGAVGSEERSISLPAQKLRHVLGVERIKSLSFSVSLSSLRRPASVGSTLHLEGRGYGHGVGLCQWGAKVMGEKGFTTASILKHYYPDANLVQVW